MKLNYFDGFGTRIFNVIQNNNRTLLLWAIALIFLSYLITRIILAFSYAPDICVGEDNNIWNIQKMLLGEALYTNPSSSPFEVFQYSPLSQYPIYWIAAILDLTPGKDVHAFFIIGRLLVLLYNLITYYIVYSIFTKLFKADKLLSFTVSFVALLLLTRAGFVIRPDALFHLTLVYSIYFMLKYIMLEKKWINLLITAFLIATSIMVKQNGIQLILIISAFLLVYDRFKIFLQFTLYFGIFIGIYFAFFYSIYGELFFTNTIGGISNPINFAYGFTVWDIFFNHYFFLIIVTLYISLTSLAVSKYQEYKFLSSLALGTLVFAIMTSLKEGSGISYYSDFLTIAVILTYAYISVHKISIVQSKSIYTFVLIGVLLFVPNTMASKYFHDHIKHVGSEPKLHYLHAQEISAQIKKIEYLNNTVIFTPDKYIKNFIPELSILPNTEYYSVSPYNYDRVTTLFKRGEILILMNGQNSPEKDRTILQMKLQNCNFERQEVFDDFVLYKIIE
ncbi:MAG: hypothetical protein QNK23_03770 [Crocinitomicaceae bacterium]|nr:hypothetical protein [Crocinitomicaceae bacterium]